MSDTEEDISGTPGRENFEDPEDVIESFLGSIFSPQFTRRMMNRNENDEEHPMRRQSYRNIVTVGGPRSTGIMMNDITASLLGSDILPNNLAVSPFTIGRSQRNIAIPLNNLLNLTGMGGRRINHILETSMNDTGGTLKKASSEFIASLNPPEEVPPDTVCGICQDDVSGEDRETLLELPCKHIYNKECILEWFKKSASCPICREEFDSVEVSLHSDIDNRETDGSGGDREVENHDDDVEGEEPDDDVEGEEPMREDSEDRGQRRDADEFNMRVANLLLRMMNDVTNTIEPHSTPTPTPPTMQGMRSTIVNEDTILQEMILRSLRET